MTDREEREEHIKRLEAALACEEKQSSGKCSKQTCDDNCALLYEQGNWGEWKETLRYAINSLKIDLKYDLLYEGVDCNNCKNNLHRGDGSTYCATGDGICHYEYEEPTAKNDLGVDAVSRKAVIDLMMQKWGENFSGDDAMQESIDAIRVMPSVTPTKGHWIEQIDHEENCRTLICSNCDRPALHDGDSIWKHKFCPHCGADMREVEE